MLKLDPNNLGGDSLEESWKCVVALGRLSATHWTRTSLSTTATTSALHEC